MYHSRSNRRDQTPTAPNQTQVAEGEPRMADAKSTASIVPGSRFSTHKALYALAQDLCLTYPISSGRKDAALARGYIALDALLAAAQAEIAKGPSHYWEPIETAPKDGTIVLVYDKSWCGGGPRISATSWVAYRHKEDGALEWRVKGGFSGVSEPTHWMPMLKGPR